MRVRRLIKGTMETARRSIETIRQRQHAGTFGWPLQLDTPVSGLTQLVVDDYRSNHYKSLRSALTLQTFWDDLAGSLAADPITADRLLSWANEWTTKGLSPARVNRRMAFLLRGYRLGLKHSPPLVNNLPGWTKRKEAAPRTGYRSWDEFVKVRQLLPLHAKIPVSIAYWFGMRLGEVLSLHWSQVVFNTSDKLVEIRLQGKDTKTNEPRLAIIGGDLYEVLLAWYKRTQADFPDCPRVCHRDGKRLTTIKTTWQTSCVKSGLGQFRNPNGKYVGNRQYIGALIHDFRRTGVTNMENAGIPRKVAMAVSGHKTDSVYRRYHIVKKEHLIEAGRKLLAHHAQQHGGFESGGHSVVIPLVSADTLASHKSSIVQPKAGVAQLAEQRFRKPQVGGSSPTAGSRSLTGIPTTSASLSSI